MAKVKEGSVGRPERTKKVPEEIEEEPTGMNHPQGHFGTISQEAIYIEMTTR